MTFISESRIQAYARLLGFPANWHPIEDAHRKTRYRCVDDPTVEAVIQWEPYLGAWSCTLRDSR
jgi:hypothetical protein